MTDQPFVDHATPILEGDPLLSDELRADLWDTFHNTKSPEELALHLQPLAIPDDTKQRLFDAKKRSIPPIIDPLDKASAAIARLATLPPDVLEAAETHPNVLKTLAGAATQAEKASGEPAGASKGGEKGKTAGGSQKPQPLAQPPRADGLQHLPPIPDGHHRILASDGGIHDIPAENIEKAREIDPNLHVLNP